MVLLIVSASGLTATAQDELESTSPRVGSERWPSGEERVMGTVFRVVLRAEDDSAAHAAIDRCFRIFEHVDSTMSEWKPESPLSELNRNAGIRPVVIPQDLFDILALSIDVARRTDGAFDVTWASLRGLWTFGDTASVPDSAEVADRVALVDWESLMLDAESRSAFLERSGMTVGLGGIAKGYALDEAAETLRSLGYRDFLLDAGGQIYAGGNAGDRAWKVGIRDPRGGPEDWIGSLSVEDASTSSSGDYEHYFIGPDGVWYHHIIDPATGWPARGVRSVCVLHPQATLADAMSTAVFVLGPVRGVAFAEREGFDALVIDDEDRVFMTEGMRERVTFR